MLVVAALAGILFVLYMLHCRIYPYAPCKSCAKTGTSAGSTKRFWNRCRTCGGSGERLRFGARLLDRR